ncbi:BOLA class I histocompatibility antigen, alpha chain BL3-7-like isoform X2 [Clarias gariepinus]|uniref:BOLA class I histocompatibility antigen, alpha chain BL3-7-like isoform X2 n=1 Tax=Clarias gariepinus TaxID=13013 RepID=UPI00234E0A32|nr:BOLA class I histocompatibility antigen, alpha chain BL3-7-like isoform X2 [Clarias gariepinus]
MCRSSAVIKTLIFLTFSLHLSSAVTHSLQYCYTAVTPGIHFPEFTAVGQVDGQQFELYDSNIKKAIPKTEWILKVTDDHPEFWNRHTQIYQNWQEIFKTGLNMGMKHFNHSTGVYTAQLMFGCELDEDGTTRGHAQLEYDGEDFLSLDLKTKTWIPAKHGAEMNKHIWNYVNETTKNWNDYVSTTCIDRINMYVSYGAGTLERKVNPEVSVFQKRSASPDVVCHTTGFFPKPLNITWQKDRENVHEDVELRETLPNQDGSFQRRSILKVPAEELQKHNYTCVVQHSSLEKELVREVPKGGGSIAIITAVVAALAALVAVVAGIIIWKKKNSGFTPVPPKPSSEGDSSTNNS